MRDLNEAGEGQSELDLSHQVGALTHAVNDLRETLRLKFYTARRAMIITIVGLIVIVSAGFVVNTWQVHRVNDVIAERERDRMTAEQKAVDAAVVSCLNTNAARAQLEARFEQNDALLTKVFAAVNPATTDDVAKARQQVVDKVTADITAELRRTLPPELGPRDCSPQAVTSPTLVEKR